VHFVQSVWQPGAPQPSRQAGLGESPPALPGLRKKRWLAGAAMALAFGHIRIILHSN
jgi:hypothetical protein